MCLQRPHDSRVLVRKRYRGHIFVSPADDRTDPVARVGPLAHAIDAPLGSGGWTVGGSLNCGWGRPSIAYDAIAAGEEKAGPLLKVVLTHPALVCLVCSVRVYGRRWTSLDDLGCRGQKTRLQLRSSLTTLAKKVIGKQRLTVLVNVSFPAPHIKKGKPRLPFFVHPVRRVGHRTRRDSKAVMQRIANPSSPVRLRIAPPKFPRPEPIISRCPAAF